MPEDIELRSMIEYEAYVTRIRQYGVEMFEDMKNGVPPNQAVGIYNEKMDQLRSEFTIERTSDYAAVRKVQQMPQHEAEKKQIGRGEPRHTDVRDVQYTAPEDMIYKTHDFNIQSSYGDCHAYISVSEDGVSVVVRLTARGRYVGDSHIIATPIIVWKVDPNEITEFCRSDFDSLERLADDRYFSKFFNNFPTV
ncbi:hypothetical protein HPB58_09535 [Priestia filamentosa]|uniref:hypothetical protein n=1 Tax=Priestia filamentosa TaxID=1402861 RepID=UPI001FB26830|nr:hypothetical protein [Priestia filamentosa]MED3729507.1 hypothetical protein [Priestia filamentosa]UOE62397.1 hypothetical protein HPB58_09535 [Priestia filamentosa]